MRHENKKGLRAAIYCRVSTTQQVEDGDSLREQESTNIAWCNDNGCEIVGTYIDGGVSRTTDDREDYKRLMQDVKNGKVDIIVFTFLSRWFGNMRLYLNTQHILNKHNVEWVASREDFYDTTTAMGRAFVNMSMMMGELEPGLTSERIKATFDFKIKQGEAVSGSVPMGFKLVPIEKNGKIVKVVRPNDDAHIVVDVFNKMIEFASTRKVQAYLWEHYGISKHYKTLQRMLANTKYIGLNRGNENFCPAIVDKDIFYTVQKIVTDRKITRSGNTYFYIFSGLLKCPCGMTYSGNSAVRKQVLYYYRCSRKCTSNHLCDNNKNHNEKNIERLLLENIQSKLRIHLTKTKSKKQKKQNNSAQISAIKNKLDRLKKAYLAEIIEIDEYSNDRATLEKQLSSLQSEPEPTAILNIAFESILSDKFLETYEEATREEKAVIWRSIIDRVYLDKDGTMKVIFLSCCTK